MPQGPGGTRRRSRQGVPAVSGSGGGGTTTPTAIVGDDVGASDAIVGTFILKNESVGASDALSGTFILKNESVGASDALSLTATVTQSDDVGPSDALNLEVLENAKAASVSTPDADAWGDVWVDRTIANAGTHQANGATIQVAAVTALTENDGYIKINFNRLVSFTNGVPSSTLTLTVQWPTVALTPAVNLHVDFSTSAGSPFVESTATANTLARFSSASPFTQRTFAFNQDGTLRTHVVTFTAAETANILGGKWLLVQITVPDLTVGIFTVRARRQADATVPKYDLFASR